jgi:quercetin dioxygenase-like cupin family protein
MAATPAGEPTGMHPLDAMAAAPDHHETILENESVRVLDTRLAPGERTPVHAHQWASALYVLSWSDFVRRDAEGKVIVDSREWARRPEMGEALWGEPLVPHSVENVGAGELRIVAVEVKAGVNRGRRAKRGKAAP